MQLPHAVGHRHPYSVYGRDDAKMENLARVKLGSVNVLEKAKKRCSNIFVFRILQRSVF